MNETSFIRSVHRKLPADIYVWKINARYVDGIPDAWYSGTGGHLFVEYKFVMLPKRPTTLVRAELSALQYNWLIDRQLQGRPVAVIIGSDDGGVWFEDFDQARRGIPQNDFRNRIIPVVDIARKIAGLCQRDRSDDGNTQEHYGARSPGCEAV